MTDEQFQILRHHFSNKSDYRDYRKRSSKIYFDESDQFQLEELLPEYVFQSEIESDDEKDEKTSQVQKIINDKYHHIVICFGDEDNQIIGTTKIKRSDICLGQDKTENALMFVRNLEKVSKAGVQDV